MRHRRTNASKSLPLSGDNSHPVLYFKKKRFTTVKTPGVMLLMSSRGMDPYRLHTSRLQKPWMSPSISNKNSMKSSVFFKCAGICLSRGLRDLVKYLESEVAGVSVAA